MEILKKILVPFDFSAVAENALNAAVFIAAHAKADVHLAYFYQLPMAIGEMGQPIMADEETDYEEKFLFRLGEVRRRLKSENPELNFYADVKMSFLTDGMQQLSEQDEIDLIVMGTHEPNWLEEYLLGTNTSVAIKSVKVPLLVVPENTTLNKIRKILFPTDFQKEDLDVINKLFAWTKIFQSSIQVVHLQEVTLPYGEEQLALMEEWTDANCRDLKITFRNKKVKSITAEQISTIAESIEADLVVMTTAEKNLFDRLILGSMTKDMIFQATVPVLICHIDENSIY